MFLFPIVVQWKNPITFNMEIAHTELIIRIIEMNIGAAFMRYNIKNTEHPMLGIFQILFFFRQNNPFIQLNGNEIINRVNDYENDNWKPNPEVRIK